MAAKKYHRRLRSTAAGEHRPVMLAELLHALDPQPGQVIVDCTAGFGGHAVEILRRVGPTGKVIALDLDAENLPKARTRLIEVGSPFALHHANFAGLMQVLADEGVAEVDGVLADLGMSSMQVDDPERGFSYARDGILDMRMDRSRGKPASQILAEIAEHDLADALRELGDEPEAEHIAEAIIIARREKSITRSGELTAIIMRATGNARWQLQPQRGKWNLHPAARTFQTLRLLTNRELGNLGNLLRILPTCVRPNGCVAVISFHSGEDRLVKASFREGVRRGIYREIAEEPLRPSWSERQDNPRSRSAKLRWARRAGP
jgi:16S rRNA (cytosine1402-N4)-methyltransferase